MHYPFNNWQTWGVPEGSVKPEMPRLLAGCHKASSTGLIAASGTSGPRQGNLGLLAIFIRREGGRRTAGIVGCLFFICIRHEHIAEFSDFLVFMVHFWLLKITQMVNCLWLHLFSFLAVKIFSSVFLETFVHLWQFKANYFRWNISTVLETFPPPAICRQRGLFYVPSKWSICHMNHCFAAKPSGIRVSLFRTCLCSRKRAPGSSENTLAC